MTALLFITSALTLYYLSVKHGVRATHTLKLTDNEMNIVRWAVQDLFEREDGVPVKDNIQEQYVDSIYLVLKRLRDQQPGKL